MAATRQKVLLFYDSDTTANGKTITSHIYVAGAQLTGHKQTYSSGHA